MHIALVGRTNVGKSTLFNKVIEESKAMVSGAANTTRDRNYGICKWQGKSLIFIDTGGLDISKTDVIEKNIRKQAELAIAESDAIIFLVDAKSGITNEDRVLARELRKNLEQEKKPIFLVANKADQLNLRKKAESDIWKALGFGKAIPVSAANGTGVGDLLDILVKKVKPKNKKNIFDKEFKKFILVGKPNVGKSSIVNSILNEERVIVSNIPHTTREPEDSILIYDKEPLLLIDTAGMRKKAKVGKGFEKKGVSRSVKALERADVAFLVLDVSEDLGVQDKKIANLILEKQKGLIIIANKIDLVNFKEDRKAFENYIKINFPFLKWAPIIFVSAKDKKNINKILLAGLDVYDECRKKVENSELQKVLDEIVKKRPKPRIYKLKQLKGDLPKFGILVKSKETIHSSFLKFIENSIREKFGFRGAPIKMEILNIK